MKNGTRGAGLAIAICAIGLGACSASSSGEVPDGSAPGSSSGGHPDGGSTSADGGSTTPPGDGGTTPDGSKPGTDAGGTTITGATNVKIIVEPNGNSASELVAAINAATKSVHMTMYLMNKTSIIDALINRSKAGIDVKVILNDFSKQPGMGSNTGVLSQLQSAGVAAILSNPTRFTYTHEKCVIIDGATTWIMTMNANSSSPDVNREYLAIDSEAADATEAEQIFAADYANTAITATGPLVVAPQAPNNARSALVALIDSATKTVDLEGEEFSDLYSTGIATAISNAAKRGVTARVTIANSTPTANETTAIALVKAAGAKVVFSGGTSGSSSSSNPYIHAKAITVDCVGTTCARGWVGSENMTGGSLGYNRELGVVILNVTELAKMQAAINGDFAAGTPQ